MLKKTVRYLAGFGILILCSAILTAILVPRVEAARQRAFGQLVSGANSSGTVYDILVDSSGVQYVRFDTSGGITANTRSCPASTTWCTPASFNTNGIWTIQNITSNTVTSSSTVITGANLANNTFAAVTCGLTDGTGKFVVPGGFSIPAKSELALSWPQGILFNSGIIVSCATANAVDVGFAGVQAP